MYDLLASCGLSSEVNDWKMAAAKPRMTPRSMN